MAHIVPDEIDAAARRGQASREIETLERLERELSDEYTVYHGVHWARSDARAACYGEIDFIIVNRLGRAIAIEQKNGVLGVEGSDLVKSYASGTRGLRAQVTRNLHNLMREFGRRFPDRRLDIDHLLYLPDHEVRGPLPAAIDPSRVVDATGRAGLAHRIVQLFDERETPSSSRDTHGGEPPDPYDVHVFLADIVDVAPSVDSISRLARGEYRRLSSGLSTWVRRLEMAPFKLRVIGTAGSGKTQLALEELRAAHAAGKSALYVCFNRTLADAMRLAAPEPEACNTFHELGAHILRQLAGPIDYAAPDAFDRLALAVLDTAPSARESVDLLIVDEGQDFQPEWAQAVLQRVRSDGRCLWMEDPSQNLYGRSSVPLPGWTTIRSPVNCRSPHVVVTLINALQLTGDETVAGGAVHGFDPQLVEYSSPAKVAASTATAVRQLIDEGHAPSDIAVISWHGRARSSIAGLDTIADLRTRRFTGAYTEDGRAVLSEGALQLETLFRFKGQAADCVVITEIDFDAWTDDVKRRLFVGLTRARLKIALVASTSAARLICERLGQA